MLLTRHILCGNCAARDSDWGVNVVINGIMESWRQRQDKIRFIQVRPEEAAALSA